MSPADPRNPDDLNPPAAEPVDDDLPTESVNADGLIDLGQLASIDDEGSGFIPLANLPDPPSGQSLTSWTEVIRRQRAVTDAAPVRAAEPVVDAPSDRDLLSRMADEGADTSEIPTADIPGVRPRSASEIDLGAHYRPGPGMSPSGSEVGFEILSPPSDAGGAMRPPGAADYPPLTAADFPGSGTDLPFAGAAAEPLGDSFAGLGDDPGDPNSTDRSSILDVLVHDSQAGTRSSASDVLAYGQPPAPRRPSSHDVLPPIPAPRRSSSHDALPPPPPPSDWMIDEVPGEDLGEIIPESRPGVDAVVDLYAEAAHRPPSITDSGSLEISAEAFEEARRQAAQMESSSVDLSSRPGLVESAFDLNAPSAADIDLNLPAGQDDASSSMVYTRGVRENQQVLEAEFEQRRQTRNGHPPEPPRPARLREVSAGGDGRQFLLRGTVLGMLIATGGALAAYFGGLVPNSSPAAVATAPGGPPADVVKLQKDLDAARAEATAAKNRGDSATGQLAAAKQTAMDAVKAEQTAKADLTAATAAAATAKKDLTEAMKSADAARAEAVAAKKELKDLSDTTGGLAKAFKDAGLDAAKPAEAIKTLVDARAAAEAKEKETAAKVVEADKKVIEAGKLVETAKKAADEAMTTAAEAKAAQAASSTTLTALAERLEKAKFVGAKADGPALVKGIEDALKAASTDATAALRDELAKTRADEAKAKTDLAAATAKEAAAAKAAEAAKAEATKLADLAKAAETKATAEAAKAEQLSKDLAAATKGADEKVAAATKAAAETNDKLKKDLAAATKGVDEKVAAAVKTVEDKAGTEVARFKAEADRLAKDAEAAKAAESRAATETARLKTDNERLARELDAVKDLAAAIRSTPGSASAGPVIKPDAGKIADRYYGEGLTAFYRGRMVEAESGFRKAIQFQPDDARYHYLLGVALWTNGDQKEAEVELKKAHDLELAGRPDRRAISAALERIQGPARAAVNAYRP